MHYRPPHKKLHFRKNISDERYLLKVIAAHRVKKFYSFIETEVIGMFTKAYIRHNPGTDDSYLGLYPHILFHLYIILNISIFAYGNM
jgi:hypothetical protein